MRLAMFVDGWNMYWSLRDAKIRPFGWCDFKRLAQQTTGYADAAVRVSFLRHKTYRTAKKSTSNNGPGHLR